MSEPSPKSAVEITAGWRLMAALGGVALLCGVLIVAAFQSTLEPIAKNRRIALERSIFSLIPDGVTLHIYAVSTQGLILLRSDQSMPKGAQRVYAVYDAHRQLRGLVAEAGAVGYADVVRVLYAYDPQRQAIVGFAVGAHRETPGIGDKIRTDAAFQKNFVALEARLDVSGQSLAHPIRTVKHGSKRQPWEIDAISGATITSRAVGRGINDSVSVLLPRLRPHLDKLESPP
jgi:electron transport complex protein RnfG